MSSTILLNASRLATWLLATDILSTQMRHNLICTDKELTVKPSLNSKSDSKSISRNIETCRYHMDHMINMTYLTRSFNPFLHSFPSSRTKQPRCLFRSTQEEGGLSGLICGERLCVKKYVSRFQNFSKLSDSSAVVFFRCV